MTTPPDLVTATKEIVVAYVAHNNLSEDKVPGFIESVFGSMTKISGGTVATAETPAPETRLEPAVPIKKSVHSDYIICLEDGKRLKVMTRYLKTRFNLTPEEYRRKWGLPHDYPMTAPGYSKQRSQMASEMGLGTMRRKKGRVAAGSEQLTLEKA